MQEARQKNELLNQLEKRCRLLESVVKEKKKVLKNAVPGCLIMRRRKDGLPRYYAKYSGGREEYLRKNDARICYLAQKAYDKKMLLQAKKELLQLKRFLNTYHKTNLEECFYTLNPVRQSLIQNDFISDEEYAKAWMEEPFETKGIAESTGYYTLKLEEVRSKSEVLIADSLTFKGIPYRYEPAVEIAPGVVRHPDFQILRIRDRKVFYWEHCGRMDDPLYVKRLLVRLAELAKIGIIPGKNLILTFEGSEFGLQTQTVRDIIEYVFAPDAA